MTSRRTSRSKSPLDAVAARTQLASIKRRLRALQREASRSSLSRPVAKPVNR